MQKLLSLPIHDDVDQARKGRYLILLAWLAILIVVAYGLLTALFLRENISRLGLAIAVIPLALAIYILVRRGQVRLAGWIFTISLWSILALSAYSGGGIRNPGFVSQMMIVLISGILISWRVSVFFAVLSSIFGLVLMTFQVGGLLPINPISPITDWATNSVLFIEVALVLLLATRSIRDALDQARQEIEVRKAVERELRASQRVLAQAQQLSQIGSWEWEPDTGFLRWSAETFEIFGVDPEGFQLTFEAFSAAVARADQEGFQEIIDRARRSDEAQASEFVIERPDATVRTVSQFIQRQRGGEEGHIRLLGTIQDITPAKLAAVEREQLLDAERRQRRVAETSTRIGIALSASADLTELMELICQESRTLFRAHSSFVWLREGDEVVGIAGEGGGISELVGRRLPIDDKLTLGPRVMRANKPIFVNHANEAEIVNHQLIERYAIKSFLGVPLSRGDHAVGALILIDHEDPDRFIERDSEEASVFGNFLAVAIEKAQLFAETERQAESLRALFETALLTSSVLDTAELLDLIHDQIQKLFEPDTFTVVKQLNDKNAVQVLRAVESGHNLDSWNDAIVSLDDDMLMRWLLAQEESRLEADLLTRELAKPLFSSVKPARSWLGVPLLVHGDLIGAMTVQSFEPQAFSSYHLRLLESMAAQISVALENARLYEETSQNAAEMEALVRISAEFRDAEDQTRTLQILAEDTLSLSEADLIVVSLAGNNPDGMEFAITIGEGAENETLDQICKALHQEVIQNGQIKSVDGFRDQMLGQTLISLGYHGFMGIPLKVQNRNLLSDAHVSKLHSRRHE